MIQRSVMKPNKVIFACTITGAETESQGCLLGEQRIQILPHLVNCPLHLHQAYSPDRRPARMNDLISGRYDTFFNDPGWPRLFPSQEPLTGWLARQLAAYELATIEAL